MEGAVQVGNHFFGRWIGRIQVSYRLHKLRPCKGVSRGESRREALLSVHLKRVIPGEAGVHDRGHTAELRIGL